MAAQKGKDLLLKMHDGAGFVTVAGLRAAASPSRRDGGRDHAESADRWPSSWPAPACAVPRCGTRPVPRRGLRRAGAADLLRRRARELPGGGAGFRHLEGPFQIASFELAGEHNGEVTFELARNPPAR